MSEQIIMSPYEGQPQMVPTRTAAVELASNRQTADLQAGMLIAKRFPRDEAAAWQRIMTACKRRTLAESAVYEFPRGDKSVSGPSIRLAETLAQSWGNIDTGVVELERKPGESTVMAYAVDLETNARQTMVFAVPHIRTTKRGDIALTDPRDIYEAVANQGARRKRACILGIIPGDIVDGAIAACQETLASGAKEPLEDRVRKMLMVFRDEFGVPSEAVERYLGCKASAMTEQSIVKLRGVYTALRDGRADREQYFDLAGAADEADAAEAPAPAQPEKTKPRKGNKAVSLNDL